MSSKTKIPVEKPNLLVKKAQQGDAEAFGDLYEIYADEMYRYALWYLGVRELAEDAVSDAVCNAFVSISSLRNPDVFKAWIFKILANCCKSCLSGKIQSRADAPLEDAENHIASCDDIASAELWEFVRSLEEPDREILLLSVVGGYKSGEIGDMLSMPSGTVRSRLSRAISKLRGTLVHSMAT